MNERKGEKKKRRGIGIVIESLESKRTKKKIEQDLRDH